MIIMIKLMFLSRVRGVIIYFYDTRDIEMHICRRDQWRLIAIIFLTVVTVKRQQLGKNNEYNSRTRGISPSGSCYSFPSFFFPLLEIASIFPREATLTALLILHHVLVRREQMPLDDRRVFSVVTISVLGTSETKYSKKEWEREKESSQNSIFMACPSCKFCSRDSRNVNENS